MQPSIFNKHPSELTEFEVGKLQRIAQTMVRENNRIVSENWELKYNSFREFNSEDCWVWQGNGEDRLTSLVCPVVIRATDLLDLLPEDHPEWDLVELK